MPWASTPGPSAEGQLFFKPCLRKETLRSHRLPPTQQPLLSPGSAVLPEMTKYVLSKARRSKRAQAVCQHRFVIPVAEGSQDNRSLFIFNGAGWEQLNVCRRLQAVMDIACHAAISSRLVQLTGRVHFQNG